MLQYVCDWCGRVKRPGERWILGFAGETEGVTMRQREVAITARWMEMCHPLAVHFCSEEHKNNYVNQFFATPGAATRRPRPKSARTISRRDTGFCAVENPPSKMEDWLSKAPAPARKHPRRSLISKADIIRLRGLGICV